MPDLDKERFVARLVEIAEAVASGECEERTRTGGGAADECENVFPDDDDWCLRCLAKRAWEDYYEAE